MECLTLKQTPNCLAPELISQHNLQDPGFKLQDLTFSFRSLQKTQLSYVEMAIIGRLIGYIIRVSNPAPYNTVQLQRANERWFPQQSPSCG
jgi:hypothetical protein